MTLEELKSKAKELGIEVPEDADEDKLQELIQEEIDKKKKADDDSKDIDHWKSEAKAAFENRDTEKKKRRQLEKQMTDLKKKLDEAPDASKLTELEEQLETLSEFRTQIEKEKEEKSLKDKSEIERAEHQHNKTVEGLTSKFEKEMKKFKDMMGDTEKKLEEKDNKISSLRKNRLESEIMESAVKHKAINPRQIMKILKNEFDYNEDLDEYESVTRDKKGKVESDMDVDEKVKDFLGQEENENLVEASVNTDGLNTDKTKNSSKSTITLKKDGIYDPNDKELIAKAEEDKLEIGDYIDVLKMRDAKLGKNKKEDD